MNPDLARRAPLVCPGCRTRSEDVVSVHTVSVTEIWRSEGSDVLDGVLRCDNPDCSRAYPILDGVPVLVRDLAAFVATWGGALLTRPLDPRIVALLGESGEGSWSALANHVSTYLDAHWGDLATPKRDGEAGTPPPLVVKVRLLPGVPDGVVVELGAAAGRHSAEAAQGAGLVVSIDAHHATLGLGRRVTRGESVAYARRAIGTRYQVATIAAPPLPGGNVLFVCGDVLDPPLAPGVADRVLALNLLDAVADPERLLSVMDALVTPGGELVACSPYAFATAPAGAAASLAGEDPARALRGWLEGGHGLSARYTVLDEDELEWTLQRDARARFRYAVHWLRARKASPAGG